MCGVEQWSGISLTVLGNIVDLYNRNTAVVINAAQHNPSALLDDAFTGSIGSSSGFTKEVQLTNFKPSGTARYYYALLGMAAMMAMSFAVNAVSLAQANLVGTWHSPFRRSPAETATAAGRFSFQLDLLVPKSDRGHAVHSFRLPDFSRRS